jgi:hypothetical protein
MDSAFCPSCGQKGDIHRISIGHVLHEGFHSITHADKGFLLLLKGLLTKPGFIARDYLEGKRKKYFNPVSFLVISTALLYYIGTASGYMDLLIGGGSQSGRARNAEWAETFEIARTSGKWLTLLFIAPLSAFLSWIFFIGKKFNYAEHFILHAFILAEAALFRMAVMIPVTLLFPGKSFLLNMAIYEPIFLIYLAVAYHQFFKQHIVFTTIKALFIRILFIVLYWAIIYLFVFVKHLIL